jgi:bla regulator protein blaR1
MILNSMQAAPHLIANHLWQSSWFALAIGALTLLFRKNQARIRFGLWLAASIKFLIPFSLLVTLGSVVSKPHVSASAPLPIYTVIQQASQPFTDTASTVRPFTHNNHLFALLPSILGAIWFIGFLVVAGISWIRWHRLKTLVRQAQPLIEGPEVTVLRALEQDSGVKNPVPFLVSSGSMEPGIFGILRPVLIWPEGISNHLSEPQLRSILAHELWHVRRRDNLAAALHMLVEAAFWFHPVVWWVGAQMVDERERACDEQVLQSGNQPDVYAESILKACRFCVEAPLTCVSGVAGSNLKRRIVRIMNRQLGRNLTLRGKLTLAALAVAAVAAPIAVGVYNSPQASAQEDRTAEPAVAFDQATIRPGNPSDSNTSVQIQPGMFIEKNASLTSLIAFAYGVHDYQITGLPAWADTERFDIDASWKETPGTPKIMMGSANSVEISGGSPASPPPPPPPPPGAMMTHLGPGKMQQMLKTLLAERFNLKIAPQTQNLPVFDLVIAPGGAKLTPTFSSADVSVSGKSLPLVQVRSSFNSGGHELIVSNASPAAFADLVSQQLNRQVVDKTGLTGLYEIMIHWPQGQTPEDIGAAIEDQLGLKLEPGQGPVKVLVINQVEKPTAD